MCSCPVGRASSMPDTTVNAMLKDEFEAKHVDAAVRHFTRMVQDFQQREWEDASAKAGKFVEAVLKAVWRETAKTLPKGKAFMANIDGRVYVDIANSAREAALLILYAIFPKRMSEESLARQVQRHGYNKANAERGVTRIRTKVDDDDHGNLRLRNLGVREAEA